MVMIVGQSMGETVVWTVEGGSVEGLVSAFMAMREGRYPAEVGNHDL